MSVGQERQQKPLDGRYILHEKLGEGGMGSVFRATDRLTGGTVALKQINVNTDELRFASFTDTVSDQEMRLSLAREFQTLASLRHPNIISVRDYGFDITLHPYFTMTLLADAARITEAATGCTVEQRFDLLIQMLQALVYLHRQGILHRDLKPGNVVVVDGRVLVLDFGLAIEREAEQIPAGTLTYMPPEVLTGQPAEEASDLYAVGVMAYEMFAGRHPFDVNSRMFLDQVWREEPDLSRLEDVPPAVTEVIGQLLAKKPENRYPSAQATIEALALAAGMPIPEESEVIRESFLQAAQFVGRDEEMAQLQASLQESSQGQGAIWLLGGVSGVGKSRLVRELQTRALVQGILAIKGQATSEGAVRYQVWRDPLRRLILTADLSENQAGVLKPLVPDIERLLGRSVSDAPRLEGEAAQQRLLSVIVDLFRRQYRPLLLILEDLHWATDESLAVLRQLSRVVDDLPLIVVASYRTDERPGLPQLLPRTRPLDLASLPADSIVDLSVSMLGEAGHQPEILSFLQRETEGNAFFLVEVVRALAEEAGRLAEVGQMVLPEAVFPTGVRSVVQRRLGQVPGWARPLLDLVAVAGRQLDLYLLPVLDSGVDLDRWLTTCVNTAVVELRDGRWRLTHDKLREGIINELTDPPTAHQQVAQAIETVYPVDPEQAGTLAYHWGAAEQLDKERFYAQWAGQHAADQYANDEALNYFSRALELTPAEEADTRYELLLAREQIHDLMSKREEQAADLALLETLIEELSFEQQITIMLRQANYAYHTEEYNAAIERLQYIIDQFDEKEKGNGLLAKAYSIWGEVLYKQDYYQEAQDKFEYSRQLAEAASQTEVALRSLYRLGMINYLQGDNEEARKRFEYLIQVGEETNNLLTQIDALAGLAHLTIRQGDVEQRKKYFLKRLILCRKVGHRLEEADTLLRLGSAVGHLNQYEEARAYFEQGVAIHRETGDVSGQQAALNNLGFLAWLLGYYDKANAFYKESLAIARELDSRFWLALGFINLGHVARDAGQYLEAKDHYQQALTIAEEMSHDEFLGYALNGLGIVAADMEQHELSFGYHQRALKIRRKLNAVPLIMEDLAGSSYALFNQGQVEEAHNILGDVLDYLAEGNMALLGAERPLRVHYICWRVLTAIERSVEAQTFLAYAHRHILEQAQVRPDEEAQQIYLKNIPIHRQILEAVGKV